VASSRVTSSTTPATPSRPSSRATLSPSERRCPAARAPARSLSAAAARTSPDQRPATYRLSSSSPGIAGPRRQRLPIPLQVLAVEHQGLAFVVSLPRAPAPQPCPARLPLLISPGWLAQRPASRWKGPSPCRCAAVPFTSPPLPSPGNAGNAGGGTGGELRPRLEGTPSDDATPKRVRALMCRERGMWT
jgi:hypothetical protein